MIRTQHVHIPERTPNDKQSIPLAACLPTMSCEGLCHAMQGDTATSAADVSPVQAALEEFNSTYAVAMTDEAHKRCASVKHTRHSAEPELLTALGFAARKHTTLPARV